METIALASRSPRRASLLRAAGFDVRVVASEIDEAERAGEHPVEMAQRLATEKGRAALAEHGAQPAPVLSADTVVWLDVGDGGLDVFGKPDGPAEARRFLSTLSGRAHAVTTGFALLAAGDAEGEVAASCAVTTMVSFRQLAGDEIAAYLETDEPWDKAGGYGIQGRASVFVDRIEGSYANVVGLPVERVVVELRRLGWLRGLPGIGPSQAMSDGDDQERSAGNNRQPHEDRREEGAR